MGTREWSPENDITLNNLANESLTVRTGDLGGDFGHAYFIIQRGRGYRNRQLGATNFKSLRFNTTGNVTIYEDSDTDLQGVSVVGGNLQLTSAGNVNRYAECNT